MKNKMKILKITPDPENPRVIEEHSLKGLQESIKGYGDLSSLVCNKRTGQWVCGHQRNKAITKLFPGHKIVEKKKVVVNGETEWEGEILTKDNKPTGIRVRIVDKDIEWQKTANLLANDQRIQGSYDYKKLELVLEKYPSKSYEKYEMRDLLVYAEEPEQKHPKPVNFKKQDPKWTHKISIYCTQDSYEETAEAVKNHIKESDEVQVMF